MSQPEGSGSRRRLWLRCVLLIAGVLLLGIAVRVGLPAYRQYQLVQTLRKKPAVAYTRSIFSGLKIPPMNWRDGFGSGVHGQHEVPLTNPKRKF